MAAQVKEIFEGTWNMDRSENFEAFMDKMGFGPLTKKLAQTVKPSLTIAVEGETITVTISAGPKANSSEFTLDTEFDTEGENPSTAVASFTDGKLTVQLTPKDPEKGKPQTITREVVDGEIVQTMTVEDVSCKRYFKKA